MMAPSRQFGNLPVGYRYEGDVELKETSSIRRSRIRLLMDQLPLPSKPEWTQRQGQPPDTSTQPAARLQVAVADLQDQAYVRSDEAVLARSDLRHDGKHILDP